MFHSLYALYAHTVPQNGRLMYRTLDVHVLLSSLYTNTMHLCTAHPLLNRLAVQLHE
jgi:hypothetical protein